ncbi:MAG: DNA polymerase I [Nitrosopumilus sp.]|nr:DNA polymerase I [Nitrosopumilus sp.]
MHSDRSSNKKKLFLLDAMALIYRAYFALSKSPRITSKGFNTSAIFGFTNTLLEILKKEQPTHIAVAFDSFAPTNREADYSEYKANRQAMPEDISASMPWIVKILEAFRIPVVALDGFEADDIIGTLAKKAEQEDFCVYMMTPDKDFGQLVSDKVFIYKPAYMGSDAQILGVQEVLNKFKLKRVEQVIDLLALWGDAIDNIPGIPGVGEKTAQQLLSEYDTVEHIIENSSQLKGKLKEKVETYADQALMSKKLATIICDVPVELDEEKLIVEEPDKELLMQIFTELEFRNIAKRVFGEEINADTVAATAQTTAQQNGNGSITISSQAAVMTEQPALENISTVGHNYILIDTKEKRAELINKLLKEKIICFDTETTGTNSNDCELVGLSFAIKEKEAYYIPVKENYNDAHEVVNEFKPVFENVEIEKTGQNLKFDITLLKWYDIEVKGKLFDTMLAHYLIEPDMRHGMTALSETYLNYTPVPIEDLIGQKKSQQISMRQVDLETIKEYAAEDADVTLQLRNKFEPELQKAGLKSLFEDVEVPLIKVLVDMETEGVAVDKEVLKLFSKELELELKKIEKDIYDCCGIEFNIASPKQLGEVLFDHLKIDEKAKKTRTGQYATGEEVLSKLAEKHPAVKMVLEYRELQKLKNTYVDTLPEMINPRTGRIHTCYNQTVAATGRLSSQSPNLQNIPIKTEKGREVRKAFIPRNDKFTLLSADYSQVELRIVAHMSGDEAMIDAFKNNLDIHTATAAKVYGVELNEVTSEMRGKAKMVNFGIIYGISAFGLSQRLNIPRKEAAFIIEQYFKQYPKIKEYMDESIRQARIDGYVETVLGRRRYLRDINSANAAVRGFAERNAINAPIQGSAADMIKIAMIKIHKDLCDKNLRSKMILQVHDELVFDVYKEETEEVQAIVKNRMQTAIPMQVPLEVDMGTGDNWLQAH